MDEQWVLVRTGFWPYEAQLMKSLLESAGIEALVPDEYLLGAQPLYTNALGGARVLVRSTDLQRATEILDSVSQAAVDDKGEAAGELQPEGLPRKSERLGFETIRLRRRWIRLLFFPYITITVLAMVVLPFVGLPTRVAAVGPAACWMLAFVVASATHFWSRCPRCGQRCFHMRSRHNPFSIRCLHCGARLYWTDEELGIGPQG